MFIAPLANISPYITLVALLAIAAAAISLAGAALAAWSLLHPPRMTDGKAAWVLKRLSPGDLGLRFTEESFVVLDGPAHPDRRLALAAWWIDAAQPTDQCAVLIHGYADAKVGAIAWAPLFHQLGFNILAIDLRAHGESDGACCTAGVLERYDIRQALDQLRTRRPLQTTRLVLFGASLGAGVAVAVASLSENRSSDVRAVVLDSPYNDFARAACGHMERTGAGGRLFQWLAIRIASRLAAVDFGDVKLSARLPEVLCPVMIIESGNDQTIDASERQAVAEVMRSRQQSLDLFWKVPGARHLLAMPLEPDLYREQLSTFLQNAGLNVSTASILTSGPTLPTPA